MVERLCASRTHVCTSLALEEGELEAFYEQTFGQVVGVRPRALRRRGPQLVDEQVGRRKLELKEVFLQALRDPLQTPDQLEMRQCQA